MATTGLFITFEGIDGAGKSTQLHCAAEYCKELGLSVVTTREPGGTAVGASLRDLLLHTDEPLSPLTEALLFAADRSQHVEQLIKPALQRGSMVLSDRYVDSSLAYQIAGSQVSADMVESINTIAIAGVLPDRTYLFDIDPTLTAKRMQERGGPDRIESQGHAYEQRVREAFLQLASRSKRFLVIDARQSIEHIWKIVREDLQVLLSESACVPLVHDGVSQDQREKDGGSDKQRADDGFSHEQLAHDGVA